MTANTETYGFGVNPKECPHHFYIEIPQKDDDFVKIYERFKWNESGEQKIEAADVLRLQIKRSKFSKITLDVATEFNSRLKKDKIKTSRFLVGGNPVNYLFGKELMVLLWGIEDTDPSLIPIAIRNWRGLMPEERWWLYTMTNASTGKMYDNRGWRKALRFALCENPVRERAQTKLSISRAEGLVND